MPRVTGDTLATYYEPDATGPIAQVDYSVSSQPPGMSIAAGTTYDTGILYADGFKALATAVKMSQGGTLTLTRYLDQGGLLQQGAAASVAITAGQTAVLNVTDGLPFLYFRVQIANSGSSAAAISAYALLLNAN